MSGKEHKMTQDEIDELLNSDSDDDKKPKRAQKQPAEDQYDQQFQNSPIQEEDYPEDHENMAEDAEIQEEQYSSHGLENQSEVQSEIQEEEEEQTPQGKGHNKTGSEFGFKKDEDLSEAKSEFIESSKLIDNKFGKKGKANVKKQSKTKLPAKPKQSDKKQQVKPQKQPQAKVPTKPSKKVSKTVPEAKPSEQQQKKPKLSESEIKQRMKDIEESKQEIIKRKQQKKKKEDELRKQQYEQAKKLEEERKEKNRKILQEQKAKKKVENKPDTKSESTPEPQIKIPQKRTDFLYMQQKKERKQNEKMIQQKIQEQNKLKLKKLKQANPQQLKGEARKAAFIEERNYQEKRNIKERQMEAKEEDTLVIKQIKQEINECRKFNLQKNRDINRADKTITDLNKKVKEKEKLLFSFHPQNNEQSNKRVQTNDFSELTPIQKFVNSFPEAANSDQIYRTIDTNGDGVLSCEQIMTALTDMNIDKTIANSVYELLDQNSDGTVSHEEFVFLIDMELKRQSDYRKIMGEIDIADPLDLQAKILDMQTKIKYINRQIQSHELNNTTASYQQKYDKLSKKVAKLENMNKRETADYSKQGDNNPANNFAANLANELIKLKNERNIRATFLDKLRMKVRDNLNEKNRLLASRAEQNLRLEQELYRIKNEIQEKELRFLSLKKIEANKKGYLDRQTVKRKEIEQAYKKAKEYKVTITDPTKQAQKTAENDQLRLLAAVLMIQRNYRRRKARGQLQKRKQQQQTAPKNKTIKK